MNKDKKVQLENAYTKKLKKLVKNGFNYKYLGPSILNEQLKYTRDFLILNNLNSLEQEPIKTNIATLATAIAEFEAFQTAQEPEQKAFHWQSFCDFVKLNMEEWTLLNDSI
jgi:hypothetical protein